MRISKFSVLLFVTSLLLSASAAQAACTGCTPIGPVDIDRDPVYSYSAVVSYRTWYTNASGQHTSQINYLTLTGTTMAYCQQQLAAVTASPGVTVVQFCQAD